VYCHTHEGTKLDMMRQNPKICFEVDDLMDMANWRSVIAKGTFQELIGRHARNRETFLTLLLFLLHKAFVRRSFPDPYT
jgi:nitroimidazol reductase NimA-like FMN-containing flavoprotein (pyridoxamine 5'-phosphate oxidase superfamily)